MQTVFRNQSVLFQAIIVKNICSEEEVSVLNIHEWRCGSPRHTKTWQEIMLLNNEWVNNEIKEKIKSYLETNENESTATLNLWDTGKAVLRGSFIAFQTYLKKREKSQTI